MCGHKLRLLECGRLEVLSAADPERRPKSEGSATQKGQISSRAPPRISHRKNEADARLSRDYDSRGLIPLSRGSGLQGSRETSFPRQFFTISDPPSMFT